ncbi:MAG TPA: acetylornithine/succinylornithine family transaminase [Thermoanaerobaculia bacterium]|nr:acetylornithine/succinylornithine family transaminase [Thermoanaerobaculia bacterium]
MSQLEPKQLEERTAAALLDTYARTPFHPRSGKGARLVDAAGKAYWDLLAGIAVNALGHRHPRLVKALRQEAGNLLHVSNLFYHPAPTLLAERLVAASGLARAFFTNSGAEANETAIKLARLARPGRSGLVALEHGFHGRTMGALSLTHHEPYRAPFAPLLPGVTFVAPNDAAALEDAVSDETSAIFLEPILGEAGIVPLTPEFLAAARRLADATGAALVFDEIQCGLGRTGSLFAFQRVNVLPDLLTLAKPLGGGLPLGVVLVNDRIAAAIKPGQHGTTFGGNPIACRLGLEALDEIERLLPRVRELGAFFGKRLAALRRRVPAIRDVRGCGLIWGIELDREAAPIARELLSRGFVVGTARKNVIRLLPPYVVPKSALAAFAAALENILNSITDPGGSGGPRIAPPGEQKP